MSYQVKEVFYSLQGEGFHAGRPAIFCRFSQCNLWTGREADRNRAICQFCDTDFIGTDGQNGGRFANAQALGQHLLRFWPQNSPPPFVVLTGGEPLMQVDQKLIQCLHALNFEIAIETNGTYPAPKGIDWICVSPKAGTKLKLTQGHELKLVYPQADLHPSQVETLDFNFFYLQPMAVQDPHQSQKFVQQALNYCRQHPQWRLSLQTHKLLQID